MFSQLAEKFHTFSAHHQIFISVVTGTLIILASWSIEKILEVFLPQKAISYFMTCLASLLLLWILQHCILHVW